MADEKALDEDARGERFANDWKPQPPHVPAPPLAPVDPQADPDELPESWG